MSIRSLQSTDATLQSAGGKGLNLVRLSRAGFAVPPGFIITTDAYRRFVEVNRWLPAIQAVVVGLSAEDAAALERASAQIRAAFSAGKLPPDIESAIQEAYEPFSGKPVAVRSSATAEDLPDLSFAGQQDTYLNVIGVESLLDAVVRCWSSLWTARAIGYRIRNGIDHSEAALAVVVQQLVDSEVSGVLFTANPLTGLRSETVIDATLGLGEALVSGQVEPDHYVVDTRNHQILSRTLGEKKISTRAKDGGGVEVLKEEAQSRQALTDEQILELAALGQRIQQEYNFPQDIEWALADDRLYVLQSRPITSLYPLPEESFDPLIVWFSFGAVQGLLGAITPLGQDAIRMAFSGAARLFGARVRYDENRVLVPAGERLWIKISDVMRHPVGARVYQTFLGFGEPSVRQILNELANEPRLGMGKGRARLSTVAALARFLLPVFGRVARNLHDPEKARLRFQVDLESQLIEPEISGEDKSVRLAERLQFMYEQISHTLYYAFPRFLPILGPTVAALHLLPRLAGFREETRSDHGFSAVALEVTRGLPDNVTTEMDMALWRCAQNIQQDPDSYTVFLELDAAALASRYLAGALPNTAQAAIAAFMKQYGMRGLAEIDLAGCRRDR